MHFLTPIDCSATDLLSVEDVLDLLMTLESTIFSPLLWLVELMQRTNALELKGLLQLVL